jgi:hypothetical protein
VSIRDAGPALAKGPRQERLEKDGRTLTVHRPNIPASRTDRIISGTIVTSGKASPYAPLQTSRSENKRDDLQSRTGAPAAPTTWKSRSIPTPSAKPDLQADRSPKVDDNQRGKSRGPGVSPSVARGSDTASPAPSTTSKDTAPNSSLVVIGKRDAAPRQRGGTAATPAPQTRVAELEPRDTQFRTRTPTSDAPTSEGRPTPPRNQFSQPPQPQPSAPASTYSRSPSASSQSIPRQEIPRATRSTEDRSFSRPSYSAPAPVHGSPRRVIRHRLTPAQTPGYSPPTSQAHRHDMTGRHLRATSSPAPVAAPRNAPRPVTSPASSPAPVQRATEPQPVPGIQPTRTAAFE